ncbi:uncharacterized protein LOC111252065 [Varroa destructor]|uniref:Uncharacterized protein n=1 Tax=Varroa destructor TaxID=109461 RepID=A0A7M7KFU2_VARDE|nr:uncharacterized protein LOC111252065 [Varroa destructor]XP_022665179.1 uncharacterized protein LOC111252065 [Varroa destructor]XP_022665187.1 uncharacterized protein LOC111252065 [Varroa destructor]
MRRVHLEAISMFLSWLLLGTTSVHVSAQDFGMGGEIADTVAHEIEVPWVNYDIHTSASISDSVEDTQPTTAKDSIVTMPTANSNTKPPLLAEGRGLISTFQPVTSLLTTSAPIPTQRNAANSTDAKFSGGLMLLPSWSTCALITTSILTVIIRTML